MLARWAGGSGPTGSGPRPKQLCREPNKWLSAKIFFLQMHLITQKIANKFKKSQKLNMTLDMLCISSKKLVVVKLKFKFL
jgi:hypothetical protein